jgi:hypothetical protein
MAVYLEFINLIIPRDHIEAVYEGGWDQFVSDNQSAIGGRIWFDDHLMRDGAMSPGDMGLLIDLWTSIGLNPIGEKDGQKFWKDCCVVDTMFGATLPCDWIEFTEDGRSAFLKGTEPGELATRGSN